MSKIIKTFLEFQSQLKLYHWQTYSYSRHIASDELFQNMLKKTDVFVETMQGLYHVHISLKGSTRSFQLSNLSETNIISYLKSYLLFLKNIHLHLPKKSPKKDISSLLNLRDEMMEEVQQTLHLFTLK